MRNSAKAAVLIVVLGAAMMLAWKAYSGRHKAREEAKAKQEALAVTDAKEITLTLRVGGDTYFGYWFIDSPENRKALARNGLAVTLNNDEGAYADRLAKFANGDYDMIVLPINSYLEHGAKHQYPGVIVAGVGASMDADGIVGYTDKFPQGKIEELNDASLRIGYTRDSPSSFLPEVLIVDFDLFNLKGSTAWRREVNSPDEVLKLLQKRELDAGVLWEPELSQALRDNPNLKFICGSAKIGGYIKDVFVVNAKFLAKHEAEVYQFFETYFLTMRMYGNNRELWFADLKSSRGFRQDMAEAMIRKIDWYDLDKNARLQFGISLSPEVPASEGVLNTIQACVDVFIRTGKMKTDPLAGNPYRITNRSILEKLAKSMPSSIGKKGGLAVDFTALSDEEWRRLHEVGTLRVEPITFQSGSELLEDAGKVQIDKIAELLKHNYPTFRVAIRGHTSPGNEDENRKLSMLRAETVAQYLFAVHGISLNRLHAEGYGSSKPPVKHPGESPRAYNYRLPRVEFALLEGNTF